MNVNSWLKQAKTRIDALDAELILLNVLEEKDRSYLTLHEDRILTDEEIVALEDYTKQREKKIPLAYIVGHREFYGRDFLVDGNVLVPRVESEEIIDIAREIFGNYNSNGKIRILDVGTGSGCLAVTLALEIPNAEVTGVDISEKALWEARKNASKLMAKVRFLKSDLMENIKEEKYDLIVANLPYVDKNWDFLSEELKWEPETALYAENKGLEVILKMIDEVVRFKNTKYLVLESDVSQQREIIRYAEKKGLKCVESRGYQMVFSF